VKASTFKDWVEAIFVYPKDWIVKILTSTHYMSWNKNSTLDAKIRPN